MQRIEKSYTDEMLFMQEVSGKIAGRVVYGALSFLNGELNLYFRGFDEMGVMVYSAEKWILQDYEHFQIREDSPVYQRFEISNAWNELKKSIA